MSTTQTKISLILLLTTFFLIKFLPLLGLQTFTQMGWRKERVFTLYLSETESLKRVCVSVWYSRLNKSHCLFLSLSLCVFVVFSLLPLETKRVTLCCGLCFQRKPLFFSLPFFLSTVFQLPTHIISFSLVFFVFTLSLWNLQNQLFSLAIKPSQSSYIIFYI